MKTVKLNNGIEMPILGFGVYQIKPEETEKVVLDALEAGYRSIDTATAYMNEEAVGNAIKKSGIPREELFITTKLWVSDAGEAEAEKAYERSMKKLGLDYLDLYLIHQPYGDVYGSWRTMEKLYKQERIRAIGVSNFPPYQIMDFILHNEIVPAINQIETHPFHQQIVTQKFLKENGVQIESWGPFAEGRNNLFSNEKLQAIGDKYKKSLAQIVLRWLIQRDVVVIPKSVRKDRMEENLNVFDFELTSEDMKTIQSLDSNTSAFFSHQDQQTVKFINSFNVK